LFSCQSLLAKEQKLFPAQHHAVKGVSTSLPSLSVLLPVSQTWPSATGQTMAKEQKLWDENLKEQFPKEHMQPCPTSGLEDG
jgi:hypothetical protein